MEVSAKYVTDSQFEVIARGHRIMCDQPRDNGGLDNGMSPPEFLLASLATCAGYYAAQYMKTRGLSSDDLVVRVNADKRSHPARLGAFHIAIELSGLEGRHQAGVRRAVEACLIHNTLLNSPDIGISLDSPLSNAVMAAQAQACVPAQTNYSI